MSEILHNQNLIIKAIQKSLKLPDQYKSAGILKPSRSTTNILTVSYFIPTLSIELKRIKLSGIYPCYIESVHAKDNQVLRIDADVNKITCRPIWLERYLEDHDEIRIFNYEDPDFFDMLVNVIETYCHNFAIYYDSFRSGKLPSLFDLNRWPLCK